MKSLKHFLLAQARQYDNKWLFAYDLLCLTLVAAIVAAVVVTFILCCVIWL